MIRRLLLATVLLAVLGGGTAHAVEPSERLADPALEARARTLSQELKINPNTAHKVVSQLISEGMLEVHPGLGTVAAELPASSAKASLGAVTYMMPSATTGVP